MLFTLRLRQCYCVQRKLDVVKLHKKNSQRKREKMQKKNRLICVHCCSLMMRFTFFILSVRWFTVWHQVPKYSKIYKCFTTSDILSIYLKISIWYIWQPNVKWKSWELFESKVFKQPSIKCDACHICWFDHKKKMCIFFGQTRAHMHCVHNGGHHHRPHGKILFC